MEINGTEDVGREAGHVVCTVSIKVDRASESWIAGRAFGYRPAVVRTSDAVVDLLVGRFADIVDKQASCAWLKSEGKRVAEAKRPDRAIVSRGSIVERVVGRDGTVGIDAQHLPEQVGKSLRVCAVGVFPYADVELAVPAEMDGAAIVVGGRAEVVEFQDNGLAARCRGIARRGKPADPVVGRWRRNRIIKVDVVVRGEVRI